MGAVMLLLGLKNSWHVRNKSCCRDAKNVARMAVSQLGYQSAFVQSHQRKGLLAHVCGAEQPHPLCCMALHQRKPGLFQTLEKLMPGEKLMSALQSIVASRQFVHF